MFILYLLFCIFAGLVAAQLVYPFITVAASTLLGRDRVKSRTASRLFDYGCVITAYRNSAIAKPLVKSLLQQTYEGPFMIYLVADECAPEDFSEFASHPRFMLLEPNPPLQLKIRSIRYAVDRFRRKHDYVVVFDADNLAHPEFLEEINRYADAGMKCIQGQRTAKNLDAAYAALDSLGEHYKNYIERYVPYMLGGSAVISGSGMATETGLYLAYLNAPEIAIGHQQGRKMLQEDKILQNFLLRQNITIAYAKKALTFDEKVTTGEAVTVQRSRWLFSYFQNVPNALGILRRGLAGLRWNQFYFGLVTLVLPMFIQLAAAGLLFLIGLLLAPWASAVLMVSVLLFILTILWTLRLGDAPKAVWDAVWNAPRFVLRQTTALFRMQNPNKNFKPTEHNRMVSVDDLIKK